MRKIAIIALALGITAAAATLMIESLIPSPLVFVLIPGLIASMAVSGNVHAFHLWIAAVFNFGFYFLVCWGLSKVAKGLLEPSTPQ
jgi:hypothetical protein